VNDLNQINIRFLSLAIVLTILLPIKIIAQGNVQCNCKENVAFVYEHLKNSISYKKQSKNAQKAKLVYQEIAEMLMQDSSRSILDCYTLMLHLTSQIEDSHNEVRTRAYPIEYEDFSDSTSYMSFASSDHFKIYPFYEGDLNVLKSSLERKQNNEIEGIYWYKNVISIGLVKNGSNYDGYVLESKLPNWRKGELIIRLLPKTVKRFQLILGHFIDKRLMSTTDKFSNGYLMQQNWKKINVKHEDHYKQMFPKRTYLLSSINTNTQYLKLGSFSSSNSMIIKAQVFADSIAEELNAQHLIVDLRGNTGGGRKNSKYFKALLKKYKGKIYLLTNFRTKSQAERFTYMLSKKRKVTIMGDQTSGILAYGRNYGTSHYSEDELFTVSFTDMGGFQATKLENKGIDPEISLRFDQDWIEQVLEYLKHQ